VVFDIIASDALEWVIGGKADTNAAMTAMLTQISSAVKELGQSKNNSMDQMLPMMMAMMMMGKGGGGGAQVAAAPPPPAAGPPPGGPAGNVVVEVNGRRYA
jgi:hypothetical protein